MGAVDVRALAFDVFGTVVDWRSSVVEEVGAAAARHGLAVDAGAFADAWRRRYRPSMDRVRRGELGWTPLDALHRASLEELVREFSLEALDDAERDHLNRAWHRLRPWPDAVAGLRRLRTQHVLCTLSNGNVALLVDLARAGGLPFDCILSAELCRAYKPDPRTYRMAPELLALPPDRVLMVAAHADDLQSAAREGLRTAFVRRPLEWGPAPPAPAAREEPDPAFDLLADDLEDLAAQLG
jgi:2-haloacid dehalogenase